MEFIPLIIFLIIIWFVAIKPMINHNRKANAEGENFFSAISYERFLLFGGALALMGFFLAPYLAAEVMKGANNPDEILIAANIVRFGTPITIIGAVIFGFGILKAILKK